MGHSFRDNRWGLDFAASVIFALGMAAGSQIFGDSGERHLDRILFASGIASGSYATAYLVSIAIRRSLPSVRSWIWMAVGGALVFSSVMTIKGILMWSQSYQRFPEAMNLYSGGYRALVAGVVFLFIVWAVAGAVFLLIVRLIIDFFAAQREARFR